MTLLVDRAFPFRSLPFTDPVEDAVSHWDAGQSELFDFAITCHEVVGLRNGETARLANRIKRDTSTVELYAKGGGLWLAMIQQYPAEAETLRNDLYISFWNIVGSKVAAELMTLDTAKAALEHAHAEGWTVEKLRTMLPTKKAGESTFTRAVKKIAATLERDILNAPALDSGMDDRQYKRFIRLATAFVWIAKKYAEAE